MEHEGVSYLEYYVLFHKNDYIFMNMYIMYAHANSLVIALCFRRFRAQLLFSHW